MAQLMQPVKNRDAWYTQYGQAIHKWVQDTIPGAVPVVLTDAGLVYNIPRGQQVIVRQAHFGLVTTNDDCTFAIGYTDQPDGAGTFTPIVQSCEKVTGAANAGRICDDIIYRPPIRVRYCDGARSITFLVSANDASCKISCGWAGWWENEIL